MKAKPKVGAAGELTFTVARQHVIDIADEAELSVLSTPSLIWHLEHAARNALAAILEPEETTVGVQVEVEHLAATPLGHVVTCQARIIHVAGSLISFQLSATDSRETIARGLHKRRVVRRQRFNEYVRKKML